MKNIALVAFVLLAATAYGILSKEAKEKGCRLSSPIESFRDPVPRGDEVRFLAFGDSGLPGEALDRVSNSAAAVCDELGCDFALLLGDNFYPDGVKSVDDPQFRDAFEKPFGELGIPFAVVMGNHDVKLNAEAQLEYASRNKNWIAPDYSYSFGSDLARFSAVNTNCEIFSYILPESLGKSSDEAVWNVFFGHHPVYGVGSHGDAPLPTQLYWRYFLEDRYDLYLSGHNHVLAHLSSDGTEYVTSGSTSVNTPNFRGPVESAAPVLFFNNENGFAHLTLTRKKLTLRFFDRAGEEIYLYEKAK